jgi:hypothetical protein
MRMCTKTVDTIFVGAAWLLALELDDSERVERVTINFGVNGYYVGSPFF